MDDEHRGMTGCCHDFAFALNRMTGWKIGVLWHDPVVDRHTIFFQPFPTHLFCITPDGRTIDVEGVHDFKAMLAFDSSKRYTPRIEEFGNETEWAALKRENSYVEVKMPVERRIEAAHKMIMASPAFLELVRSLTPQPATPQKPASPAPQL